ncbi:MAG TPA: phytoene/squalene synthase family protein [Saprospiraceae bacterium]|nr:phytoene/squalene synthase family protein [Saprospiraceae bacterium]
MQGITLYDSICNKTSELLTSSYSTSFSMGINLFDSSLRTPIRQIYGFVRIADEIVDSFHGFNQAELLSQFRRDTHSAIKNKISFNPILNSFQKVVHNYNIDVEYIDAFLDSMEMDLTISKYNEKQYKKYIYGSAEVVGLMCLKVFVGGSQKEFDELKSLAQFLGSAFQKVNFLRDIKSDYQERGRIYFPTMEKYELTENVKKDIESDISNDFLLAKVGIERLPDTCRNGVKLAFLLFSELLEKIKKMTANELLSKRVSVSTSKKILLLLRSKF